MNIFKKCSEDGWLISQIAENVSEIELELLLSVYPEAMIQVSPFREIEFEDVKEVLEEVEDGYFNFIGSTREKELNELDNDYLTSHIFSLNTYSGFFELNKDY